MKLLISLFAASLFAQTIIPNGQGGGSGGAPSSTVSATPGYTVVTSSATPTLTLKPYASVTTFQMTLTASVTSQTLVTTNAPAGMAVYFQWIQGGAGSYTLVWPTNVTGGSTGIGPFCGVVGDTFWANGIWDGTNVRIELQGCAPITAGGPQILTATNNIVTIPDFTGTLLGAAQLSWVPASTGLTVATRTASGTNAYGLQVAAPTGATNNYGLYVSSGNVGIGIAAPQSLIHAFGGVGTKGQLIISDSAAAGTASAALLSFTDNLNVLQAYLYKEPSSGKLQIVSNGSVSLAPGATDKLLVSTSLITATAPITATLGTLTGASTPAFSSTATWNNAATTFIHDDVNVTNTASASGSLLIRRQVGGVTQFSVSVAGALKASSLQVGTIVTVSALGTCDATAEGTIKGVSDLLTPTFLAIAIGGGSIRSVVYCNGTNWVTN